MKISLNMKGSKCKKMHSPSDRLLWLKQNGVEVGNVVRDDGLAEYSFIVITTIG